MGIDRATNAGMPGQRAGGASPAARAADGGAGTAAALGLAIALGSGLAFAVWGLPRLAGEDRGAASTSRLAEVAPDDVAGALSTMDLSSADRARLADGRACTARLAWVSIVPAPGQHGVRIRLQSGGYVSPMFTLGEQPVRVALPYPAPYAAGRGTLGVFAVGGAGIVGLQPAWHVAASDVEARRAVTWQPDKGCSDPDG